MSDATIIHTRAPSLEELYTKHGYDGIAHLHPAFYCTTCMSCALQHKANDAWQTKNSARLAKEQEAYNEECWRLEEEQQERRSWFEWSHRNRNW